MLAGWECEGRWPTIATDLPPLLPILVEISKNLFHQTSATSSAIKDTVGVDTLLGVMEHVRASPWRCKLTAFILFLLL